MTIEHTMTALPAEPNAFIGRERDVADLCRMLESTRCVTLCGPGGIGKTRLALHVALELTRERYADGVRFVELADVVLRDPAAGHEEQAADPVTRRVAAALALAEEAGRPLRDLLTDALSGAELLLVLDNCEHLIDDCAGLARTLLAGCPGVRILATSREPLRMPGENVWRVPPLSIPSQSATDPASLCRLESVRLFVARADAARAGFDVTDENAPAVGWLCRALDGLPLALELAAARVRVLSVEQIADRISDRFRLLAAGDRTAPPRQRTLRAAIDWSHELLDEPEQALLRRLSVFAGWTLDQAERVCADEAVPVEQILDLLTALVDKSLVVLDREVAGETRFRLLDSIRHYAADRLAEAGEERALRDRHREAVLEAAELDCELALAARPGSWAARVALFRKYDHELDNLRAGLAWSLERRDTEEGLRLCTALRGYSLPRGYFAECEEWYERFAEPGRIGVSAGVAGPALVARAELAVEQREFARADDYAAAGLPLCRAAGDTVMEAAALTVLGGAATAERRYEDAAGRLAEALAVARAGGDGWNEGLALLTLGALHVVQGRLREAGEVLRAGLAAMRAVDQQWGVARALISLGLLARLRGDPAGARPCYEEALPILREIGASPDIARCLGGIGRTALETGELTAARAALTESLLLSRSAGVRVGVARALDAFASLTALEGDGHSAVRLAGAAAALREAMGRPPAAGARLEQTLEPIRRRLGEQQVALLWAAGRELRPADAIAEALSPAGPPAVPAARVAGDDTGLAVGPPSTLTPREREIVSLIARGLSNRGIADELVISPATVARHVTNMLTKLGFTSRAQIAAWAVDHGLAGGLS